MHFTRTPCILHPKCSGAPDLDEFFSNRDITAAVTAAQQLCWRSSKISCLSLQIVVSTRKIDVQAVSPVTELLPQVLQRSASNGFRALLRGLALQ